MSRHLKTRLSANLLTQPLSSPPAAVRAATHFTSRSPSQLTPQRQSRCYAAPPRAPKLVARSAPKRPPTFVEAYNLDAVTREDFAAAVEAAGFFKTVSADEYYDVLKGFEGAVKKRGDPYSVKMGNISPDTLYAIGCILFHLGLPSPSTLSYTSAMWTSAAKQGHRAATIAVARQLVRGGAWGKRPAMRAVESAFRAVAAEAKDANALAVHAEMLFRSGSHEQAARSAKKALEMGGGEGFEWEDECRVTLAKALLQLGRRDEARTTLEELVEKGGGGGGGGEAHEHLATLLLESGEETDAVEQHLFHAGYFGREGMFRRLAELAVERQGSAASEEEARDCQRWAMEWTRLENPKAAF